MESTGLRAALPEYLREWQEKIEGYARRSGLDFFPQVFEVLSFDEMNEVAAFGGFPTRYPHWRWGMDYERLKKSSEYGLSRIYEMVINNNPCVAYLLEGNSLTDQKLVMAHVCGHNDFFKNNYAFKVTDQDRRPPGRAEDMVVSRMDRLPTRKWIDTFANHASRVRRHMDRYGVSPVEEFIDVCHSLENLIDPPGRMLEGRPRAPEKDENAPAEEVPRLKSSGYMDSFINPKEYLAAQRVKMDAEAAKAKRFPEKPMRDVLWFLLENAPLEKWERDVLEVIPQLRDTIPEFLAAMEARRGRARAEGGGQLQPRARPAQLQARRYVLFLSWLNALIMSSHFARHLPIRRQHWAAAIGILWLVIALAILFLGIYMSWNPFDWYWYNAAKV
jgi:stage V sporulation protein R